MRVNGQSMIISNKEKIHIFNFYATVVEVFLNGMTWII